jgi:hypothetical protein
MVLTGKEVRKSGSGPNQSMTQQRSGRETISFILPPNGSREKVQLNGSVEHDKEISFYKEGSMS